VGVRIEHQLSSVAADQGGCDLAAGGNGGERTPVHHSEAQVKSTIREPRACDVRVDADCAEHVEPLGVFAPVLNHPGFVGGSDPEVQDRSADDLGRLRPEQSERYVQLVVDDAADIRVAHHACIHRA
jgi:hypothetical protein